MLRSIVLYGGVLQGVWNHNEQRASRLWILLKKQRGQRLPRDFDVKQTMSSETKRMKVYEIGCDLR